MAKRTTKKAARKTTRKKASTRRPAARAGKKTAKKTAKKAARKTTKKTAARKPAKITSARGKARTKSEIYSIISENVGISRKETAAVFDTLSDIIAADLAKGAVGYCNVPGMAKVLVQRKKATKARKGINPFTKEPTIFKAKPARNVVKIRPLKALKDRV